MSSTHHDQAPYREPESLSFQSSFTRRAIIASYCIIILAATPLWWMTTSIERLTLNVDTQSLQSPSTLPIHIIVPEPQRLQDAFQEIIRSSRNPQLWQGWDVQFHDKPQESGVQSYTVRDSTDSVHVHGRELHYPLSQSSYPDLAKLLATLINPYSQEQDNKHISVQYSPRYRLAFSLLNEDSAEGGAVYDWEVQKAITGQLTPFLSSLSLLHNFTIESQVQFHAPLALEPKQLEDGSFVLTQEDLSVFINSAEWSLSSSVSNDPLLHFVLFVPSKSRRPLRILNINGNLSPSSSFILPQWGGIIIAEHEKDTEYLSSEDLTTTFSMFLKQLRQLLGVPPLPQGVTLSQPVAGLSNWQLDALLSKRAMDNARDSRDTIESIVRLVNQIENMPVGERVKADVDDSLSALDKIRGSTTLTDFVRHSVDAVTFASRAFFSPEMLAMLYFPAEHKYAVYTPLFASALIPVVGAVLRELKEWKAGKRKLKTQ